VAGDAARDHSLSDAQIGSEHRMRERFGRLAYAALASIASRARSHARHAYRASIRRTLSGLLRRLIASRSQRNDDENW